MTTATVTWTLPPKRPFAKDYLHSIIELSVDGGANFTEIATIAANSSTEQKAVSGELAAGDWIARGTLYDVAVEPSPQVTTNFSIGDDAAPDALENLNVALS
jgi:hypothetical protein